MRINSSPIPLQIPIQDLEVNSQKNPEPITQRDKDVDKSDSGPASTAADAHWKQNLSKFDAIMCRINDCENESHLSKDASDSETKTDHTIIKPEDANARWKQDLAKFDAIMFRINNRKVN